MSAKSLLQISDLEVLFTRTRGLFRRTKSTLRAVNRVNLTIEVGESVGLVGESGSGKSTIAQAVERLVNPAGGSIRLGSDDLGRARGRTLRRMRRRVQMVFQDPYSSLDPSMTIAASLSEPLRVHGGARQKDLHAQLVAALQSVGLRESDLSRYPHEFSGGQRQRIAIARALIVQPDLLVLDEALSALDVSTRAQILQLLQRVRQERGVAFLFIGHDLAVVRRISDKIAVMYLGEVVEFGPADRVISSPSHPYTAALLASVPDPTAHNIARRHVLVTKATPPDPWNRPKGCAFAARCPFAMEICRTDAPPVVEVEGGGSAACHLHVEGPALGGRSVLGLVDERVAEGVAAGSR